LTQLNLRISGAVLVAIAAMSVIAAASVPRTVDSDAASRATAAHATAQRLIKPLAIVRAPDEAAELRGGR
jgi:hypothetical protein